MKFHVAHRESTVVHLVWCTPDEVMHRFNRQEGQSIEPTTYRAASKQPGHNYPARHSLCRSAYRQVDTSDDTLPPPFPLTINTIHPLLTTALYLFETSGKNTVTRRPVNIADSSFHRAPARWNSPVSSSAQLASSPSVSKP